MNTETRVGLFIIIGVGIFLYLSIHIGEIKLNKNEHSMYRAYFDETGGLEGKSPVKMAGVSVGWVDAIRLLPGGKAEIEMRVKSIHKLGKNAFVRISQEGLIGSKSIEIDPGDSSSGYLAPGSTLPMPGRAPTTVSGLLEHFKDISSNIGDLTLSLKTILTTAEAEERIKNTLENAHRTSKNIASLTRHANELITTNRENIGDSIGYIKDASLSLKTNIPEIATSARSALGNVDDAAMQAKDMFKEADEIMEKINSGQGLVGKLINEGAIYSDLQKTVQGIRNYVHKTQSVRIKIDGHLESMLDKSDRKGYAALNIFTHSDYFYKIEATSGKIGKFERQTIENKFYDAAGLEFTLPSGPNPPSHPKYAAKRKIVTYSPSKTQLGIQVGKRFTNLTFRTGLFEDTFGIGVDYDIPTSSRQFGWRISIEAFDFYGHNRTNGDDRMHVKWINKIYYMNNIYTVFGLDDLFGKNTATPFLGMGINFDDDDLKYMLPGLMSLKS